MQVIVWMYLIILFCISVYSQQDEILVSRHLKVENNGAVKINTINTSVRPRLSSINK